MWEPRYTAERKAAERFKSYSRNLAIKTNTRKANMNLPKINKNHTEEVVRRLMHNISMYNGAFEEDDLGRTDAKALIDNDITSLQAIVDEVDDAGVN